MLKTREGAPKSPARKPLVVKMPVPTMFETTSAVALTRSSSLRFITRTPVAERPC